MTLIALANLYEVEILVVSSRTEPGYYSIFPVTPPRSPFLLITFVIIFFSYMILKGSNCFGSHCRTSL